MDQRVSHDIWSEPSPLPEENGWNAAAAAPGSKFSFDDLCYVLFRHKWKILFFSVLGIAAAAGVYHTAPVLYRSEARLMVKYIPEAEPLNPGYGDVPVRSPVLRGETVVNSEVEILTSMDLALKVAEVVGPERILAQVGGGNDLISAAVVVNGGTVCDVPRGGNVIRVMFQHPDPALVQPVLSNLMSQYVIKHREVHTALASLEDFAQQREQIQERLHKTEQNLWDLKKTNGVFAVEESKRAAAEQVFRIQQMLSDARTELEARQAAVKSVQDGAPRAPEPDPKNREDRRERYAAIWAQLEDLRKQRLQLLGQYVESSSMVQPVRQAMDDLEKRKRTLEKEDPDLLFSMVPGSSNTGGLGFDETGRITVLKAKVEALTASLVRARAEEEKLYEAEAPIVRLQRAKELEEGKFRYLSSALENAQVDSNLSSSRVSNISRVQDPTPPVRQVAPLFKRMASLAGGGIFLGLALAVLMEFFVDQTVKRAVEISKLVPAPLFISIPRTKGRADRQIQAPAGQRAQVNGGGEAAVAAWSSSGTGRQLQPYLEALRDRVLNRFETLARKPKLVGVCGTTAGAGVTSIAAGLAASLSEAGDLKVLLVDMKRGTGKSHPILGGRKSCTLMEALNGPKRQEALIAPNLYLARETGAGNQPVVTSPRKFTTVVPQLSASDYDYIVFDMPPVDTVSPTPRLAKHMDLTLLVVEAEKARQNGVRQAGSLLLEFTRNVAVVLNKTRNYLPGRMAQTA